MSEDYHEILGVSRNATADEIRKAYKAKALKYHPDKNSSPNAKRRFQEIGRAYQFLSEKLKREETYSCDRDGGDHRGSDSYCDGGWYNSFNVHYEPESIFVDHWLSLEEIFSGCNKRRCVRFKFYPECGGSWYMKYRWVTVKVPSGVPNGEKIRIAERIPRAFNRIPFDVVFIVKQYDHPVFKRRGSDLFLLAEVSWSNFTTSGYHTIKVPLIDGGCRAVKVSRDEVARNRMLVIRGEGMTFYDNPSIRGDLLVRLRFRHERPQRQRPKHR